ncbi:MAG: hypothetical protein VKP62_14640, partial [Candidatus Sericytochromatia bacterium]|nr:hypothetical protein [Candidatus Sericytochromatia bacterium]
MVETAVAQDDDTRFSSHLLGEFLLEQGLVSEEQLEAARVQLAALPVPEAIPMGVAFVPAADGKRLQLVDPVVGTSLGSLPLVPGDEGDGELEPVGWTRYADDQLLMLEPGELAPKRWLSMADCPTPGIIPTPAGAFLYPGAPPSRATSPRIAHLPSPWLNPAGVTGPLDLYPSPQGALLVAVNRGAGTVHVISVAERVQKGAVSLRPAGHQRGMGVAITPDQRTVYLSDGLTPRLGILDLASMKLRYQLFPTGPLGSLLLNHDGSQLLACFAKGPREMGLLTISLPDLRVKHLLNLPGKGEGERPILPLTPGFDEDSAFLVTYSFETRDQVYLLQMDRARQRIHKSHALREMPWMVCQPAPEAWCPEAPDLGTALLHMGVLSEDHLKVARAHLAGGGESVLSLATVPIDPGVLARLPERLIRDRGVIPLNEIDGNLIVAMGNPSDPRSRQFAIDLAGNLPVRVLPVTATEFEAFMQERYPALMDEYYAVSSGAPPSLRMPQELRSTVPLAQGARPDATDGPRAVSPAGEVRVAPVRAPAAPPTAALLATDDWGELPGERFLLINPLKRQVAELDRTGRSAWLYSPEGDTLTRRFSGFVHAARLENANTLVVDMGANRVQEVTPARSVTWQTAEDCRLKGPRHAIRLRTGGTLVVDTGNNRLVEVDADGQPAWTYGEMGCGGDGLFKPNYVCVLGNGRLLVTDTGNHRVIEL